VSVGPTRSVKPTKKEVPVLLGLAAALPTSIALATELSFSCAGRKGLLSRPGAIGLVVRQVYRLVEKQVPLLSSIALAASIGLALSAGLVSRAGCLALGASLALGANLALNSVVAVRFRNDSECLERADLTALQSRWEVAMTTRACLHAAALVCVVASVVLS
jgi:Domain of unknown function (DUF1772)